MTTLQLTRQLRRSGVYGALHCRARHDYYCDDCNLYVIRRGDKYWRYFGRMADAGNAHTIRFCEPCRAEFLRLTGSAA